MPSTARCWTPPRAALAAATIFSTGCAGVSSDLPASACPPVVEYSRAEQSRVAGEVTALPEGALIPGWLADSAVLRDQARACGARWRAQTVCRRTGRAPPAGSTECLNRSNRPASFRHSRCQITRHNPATRQAHTLTWITASCPSRKWAQLCTSVAWSNGRCTAAGESACQDENCASHARNPLPEQRPNQECSSAHLRALSPTTRPFDHFQPGNSSTT